MKVGRLATDRHPTTCNTYLKLCFAHFLVRPPPPDCSPCGPLPTVSLLLHGGSCTQCIKTPSASSEALAQKLVATALKHAHHSILHEYHLPSPTELKLQAAKVTK